MPVKLRLQRRGRKAAPFYTIVAADSRARRDGRYIERLGFYDPVASPAKVYVDHDSAIKWLSTGAQPTNTVKHLLRHTGVNLKFALIKQGKSEAEMEKIYGRWRTEKDGKSKKKIISVDIHGTPLEPVPTSEKKEHKNAANPEPPKAEEEKVAAPAEEEVKEEAATPAAEVEAPAETEAGSDSEAEAEKPAGE